MQSSIFSNTAHETWLWRQIFPAKRCFVLVKENKPPHAPPPSTMAAPPCTYVLQMLRETPDFSRRVRPPAEVHPAGRELWAHLYSFQCKV